MIHLLEGSVLNGFVLYIINTVCMPRPICLIYRATLSPLPWPLSLSLSSPLIPSPCFLVMRGSSLVWYVVFVRCGNSNWRVWEFHADTMSTSGRIYLIIIVHTPVIMWYMHAFSLISCSCSLSLSLYSSIPLSLFFFLCLSVLLYLLVSISLSLPLCGIVVVVYCCSWCLLFPIHVRYSTLH